MRCCAIVSLANWIPYVTKHNQRDSEAIVVYCVVFFFFKQKTAYEVLRSLVGSEMCIRDRATAAHLKRRDGWDHPAGVRSAPKEVLDLQVTRNTLDLSLIHI